MIPLDWSANSAGVKPPVLKIIVSIQDPVSFVWYYIKEMENYQLTGMVEVVRQPRQAMHFDSIPSKLVTSLVIAGRRVAIELYEVPHE